MWLSIFWKPIPKFPQIFWNHWSRLVHSIILVFLNHALFRKQCKTRTNQHQIVQFKKRPQIILFIFSVFADNQKSRIVQLIFPPASFLCTSCESNLTELSRLNASTAVLKSMPKLDNTLSCRRCDIVCSSWNHKLSTSSNIFWIG